MIVSEQRPFDLDRLVGKPQSIPGVLGWHGASLRESFSIASTNHHPIPA